MEETILVTGAKGMIGSHLVIGLLNAGYKVIGIDRGEDQALYPNYKHYCCDLGNKEKLNDIVAENNISRIIHLAALAHSQDGKEYSWDDYKYLNVDCAKNVFETAGARPVLFISTVDVYGFTNGVVSASTEPAPVSHYAKSKKMAEEECEKLPHFTIFRFSPVYTDEVKRDIQKRYYLKYPQIAYQIGKGTEYEILNVNKAVQSMVDWCSQATDNDIRIIKDDVPMWTPDYIKVEKAEGRANVVLKFPRWLVCFGYMLLKLFTGKNKYTYLINKAVHPLRTNPPTSFYGTRVLVLDGYGRQIPTIVRQLSDLGCEVTTLNCSKLDVGYTSRYPKNKLLYPETKHDMSALKAVLDKEVPSGKYDVVFPMLEPSTEVCLRNGDEYRKYVKIIAAPLEAFEKAYDKQETMLACMDNDIPCPITKRDTESFEEYISKVGYPLAVKPRKGTGSVGFHCIHNAEQLQELRDNEGFVDEENIIQEYIPQTDTQYIGFFMLDDKHELKSAVIADKHRWYPVDGGAACYVQTVNRPDMVEYGYKLLKSIGWKGEAHLDFISDPRDGGKPKVMEINGRIPASIKMCWCVGVPLIKQELEYAFGEPVEAYTDEIPEGYGLRYFQTDFLWLLKSPNRFKVKPSWFNFSNSKDFIWSFRDPIPFFSYSLSHLLTYKEDMKKRKR